jgi:hypothetical protein
MNLTYTTRDQTRAVRAILLAKQSEHLIAQIEADPSIEPLVRMRICDELRSKSRKCIEKNRQEWPALNTVEAIVNHVKNRY